MKDREYYQTLFLQIIFVIFAFLLFIKEQYVWLVLCLLLLLIANRLDTLKTLMFSPKEGIKAEFNPKIIENIIENREPVDATNYMSFREAYEMIEKRVLLDITNKHSASSKIYQMYKLPDKSFIDIYVKNTDSANEIYEIKFVKSKDLANRIAKAAEKQLLKYGALLEDKPKLVLVLASKEKIDVSNIKLSNDISIEYFKL